MSLITLASSSINGNDSVHIIVGLSGPGTGSSQSVMAAPAAGIFILVREVSAVWASVSSTVT